MRAGSVVFVLFLTSLLPAGTVYGEAADLTAALRFRQTFGLSTDPALILRLAADPEALYPEHPVPLTPDERRDLDRRQYVQDHKTALLEFGRANPEMWGGLWTDQLRGGTLVVHIRGPADQYQPSIEALAPDGAAVEVRSVGRSISELEAIQRAIEADWAHVESLGVSLFAVGLSVRTNQVRVGVSVVTDGLVKWFDTRYGPGAVLLELMDPPGYTACSSRSNCPGPPLRGGISGSFACSVAFIAHKGGANYYMYTAGHCANNGSDWYHGSKYLGSMQNDATYDQSTADAALIGPISNNNISRWVYKTASSVTVTTSIQQYWEDAEGDRVCLSARMAAAVRCGVIVDTSLSIEIEPGVVLKQQVRANYDWDFGDSGGAVLNGSKAMGIQSGYVGADATYSQIGHVQNRTNSFVNVSNCGNFC